MQFEQGPKGRITEGSTEVGRVLSWDPEKRISLEWHQADWKPEEVTTVSLSFERIKGGTRVTIEHREWGGLTGDSGEELLGWFAREVAAPFLKSTGPMQFGDWLTDRRARRPTGAQARSVYRNPVFHRPNFSAILEALKLKQNDYLLEVGCGGGAFLQDALKNGCRAAAIDHSQEMVRLAREVNHGAIEAGLLEIQEGEADKLPFADGMFTCSVMTGVFGFLPDPQKALSEIHRTLVDGGRSVVFTSTKELRGTPAAPEPMASRLRFYEDEELVQLARKAGFADARVEHPDFEPLARQSGIPEEALPLFRGRAGQLLISWKLGRVAG